jgi:hypothetical protein
LLLAVVLSGLLAGSARAELVVVLPRPGQVGLGLSGSFGTLLESGDFGQGFTAGPGLAVRLRYRMRYERGFGLTFEVHEYDRRSGHIFKDEFTGDDLPPDSPFAPKKLQVYLYGLDFYQMYGTRTKTTRMLSAGMGIAHPTRELNDGETDYPGGDGFYASVGAGVERFFWQSLAWDLGVRYQAIFHEGRTNHDFQVSAGLIFYASL